MSEPINPDWDNRMREQARAPKPKSATIRLAPSRRTVVDYLRLITEWDRAESERRFVGCVLAPDEVESLARFLSGDSSAAPLGEPDATEVRYLTLEIPQRDEQRVARLKADILKAAPLGSRFVAEESDWIEPPPQGTP